MPIYEYRCSACGFEREYLQKLADAPIVVCESCGQSTMSKLVSAAGFQLKGSGWYATDFKTTGKKPPEKKADLKPEAKGDSKPEAKSDSKSESKPQTKKAATPAVSD